MFILVLLYQHFQDKTKKICPSVIISNKKELFFIPQSTPNSLHLFLVAIAHDSILVDFAHHSLITFYESQYIGITAINCYFANVLFTNNVILSGKIWQYLSDKAYMSTTRKVVI